MVLFNFKMPRSSACQVVVTRGKRVNYPEIPDSSKRMSDTTIFREVFPRKIQLTNVVFPILKIGFTSTFDSHISPLAKLFELN